MEKRFLPPNEIAQAICDASAARVKLAVSQLLVLGIFAGAFIGFGSQAAITVGQSLGRIDLGLQRFAFGAAFPIGLMLVVVCGAELFTGNNLMTLGFMNSRFKWTDIFKNWIIVFSANFAGAVLVALVIANTGLMVPGTPVSDYALGIAEKKLAIGFGPAILRGILCNILVVLAVWMATGARDIIGKLFACWFPIMTFVMCGYEHSIANMYFIPLGKFLGAPVTWWQIWMGNLIPVTIGNIIGGALIVPLVYHVAYMRYSNTSR